MYEKTELNQNVRCNMQNAMHHLATTNFIINPLPIRTVLIPNKGI